MERRSEKDYGRKSEKDYGRKFEKDFGRKSDCDISLGVVKAFFDSFIDSLRRSGLLNDSRKKSKNKGGKQARARRRERREEERRRASSLSSSPPPLTSAVDCDAAEVCMEKNDAWMDIQNEVENVSQQSCNIVQQSDRQRWNSQMQGCQQALGDRQNYQLQGCQQLQPDQFQELGENLNVEQWYFGSIPLQTAKDFLYEFKQPGTFLVRDSDKTEGFMLIWLNENIKIMTDEILFDGDCYFVESSAKRFLSVKMLIEYLEERCNFRVLPNKNQLRKLSQLRFRRSTEKLTFCWFCLHYNNAVHFCTVLQLWRKIDYSNCLILSGQNRVDVDSYKEECGQKHQVNIWLYKSRQQMNERQKINAEEWKDQKEAQRYFENNKASFMEMGYRASIEHLVKQNLRHEVLELVRIKVHDFLQPDLQEAQTYFEKNKAIFKEMGYQASMEHLRKQNFRREVLTIVEKKVDKFLQPDLHK